jgi:hypothetical protein
MNTNDNTGDSPEASNAESIKESSLLNEVSLKDILMKDFSLIDDSGTDTGESETNQPEDQSDEDGLQDENSYESDEQDGERQEVDADKEELPKNVQKRINKLTALRKDAEAKLEQMQAKLNELEGKLKEESTPRNYKDQANPYSNLNSRAEIEAEIAQARQVRRWCEENADGVVITEENGNERVYSTEDVRKIKLNAMDALEEYLPKRANYLATKEQVDKVAESEYRWYKDRSSKELQIANNFVKAFPEITKFPDYKMVVGDYIRGMQAREGNKQRQIQKAPVQPTGTSSYPSSRKDANARDATSKFLKSKSSSDLAEVLKQFI